MICAGPAPAEDKSAYSRRHPPTTTTASPPRHHQEEGARGETNKRWAGRSDEGNRSVETDWTPVEAWDRLAEQCARFIHKGSRVRVIGSLHTRSWEDRESGQKRFKTIVRADEVLFLDARERGQDEDEAVEEVVAELPF